MESTVSLTEVSKPFKGFRDSLMERDNALLGWLWRSLKSK
jgi:hypothetical protein